MPGAQAGAQASTPSQSRAGRPLLSLSPSTILLCASRSFFFSVLSLFLSLHPLFLSLPPLILFSSSSLPLPPSFRLPWVPDPLPPPRSLSPVPLSVDFPSPENLRHPGPRLHLSACVSFPIARSLAVSPEHFICCFPPIFACVDSVCFLPFFLSLQGQQQQQKQQQQQTAAKTVAVVILQHLSLCLSFHYLTLLYHIFYFFI